MRSPAITLPVVAALVTLCTHSAAQQAGETQPAAKQDSSILRPFGPGQPVEMQCDEPNAYVFVARGVVEDQPSFPDPFTKVGRIPLKLELPAGVYTVLVEGERLTSASTVFEVRHQPVHVHVRSGSQGLRDLSTLTLALGSAALLAGAVLEVSGTGDGDSDKKHKITIPLFISGGVVFASGLTFHFVSSSSIDHDGYVSPHSAFQAPRLHTFGVSGTF